MLVAVFTTLAASRKKPPAEMIERGSLPAHPRPAVLLSKD